MGKIYLPMNDYNSGRSGISIVWRKREGVLDIAGWYDSLVGIEGGTISLAMFFDLLGIKKKDLMFALDPKRASHEYNLKWNQAKKASSSERVIPPPRQNRQRTRAT